ncbi:MAG: EF-hand domain-containing protein [Gammaproteobacteria bacterium]|nr:EF-hand domain-containing protein [Gammaproteobacteria bacterium]
MQHSKKLGNLLVLATCLVGTYMLASENIRQVSAESFDALDHDGNGVISRSEFVGTYMKLQKFEAEVAKTEGTFSDAKDMRMRLKQRFGRMDADSSDSLSQEEFVGPHKKDGTSETDQASVFTKLDQDQDGSLSFEEYGAAMKRRLSGRLAATDVDNTDEVARLRTGISERFDHMDTDGDSVLTEEEYLSSAKSRYEMSLDRSKSFFAAADSNKNEALSQEEFMSAMKRRLRSQFEEFESLEDEAEARRATDNLLQGLEIRFERMDANDDDQVTQAEMDSSRRNSEAE